MNEQLAETTQHAGSRASFASNGATSGCEPTTIQSYLVFPAEGRMAEVAAALEALPECEVRPAENRPVLILVTEATGGAAQHSLERRLESIEHIAAISLVSGWSE